MEPAGPAHRKQMGEDKRMNQGEKVPRDPQKKCLIANSQSWADLKDEPELPGVKIGESGQGDNVGFHFNKTHGWGDLYAYG